MTAYQIEAIDCIKKLEQGIASLEQTIATENTWQRGYIENCKEYIASYKAKIEFLKAEYKV